MPTYEYRCRGCGYEMEMFQAITAAPRRRCPRCQQNRLERLIGTGAALLFRGSGFYQTDYRSESYRKAAESERQSATDTGAGAAAGSTPDNTRKKNGERASRGRQRATGAGG